MSTGFATVLEEDGVAITLAEMDGFTIKDLRFPPHHAHGEFEPEMAYVAFVVDGSMEKFFPRRTLSLGRASAVTMPKGATHSARFGSSGARIVVIKPRDASMNVSSRLDRLVALRGRGFSWLAWRLAGEMQATDTAAPLAAEGLALELLAATSREARRERRRRGSPPWLSSAEELLRTCTGESVRLGELAEATGQHPVQVARAFRARYGVSVGEYGRRARVEWAATQIAQTDLPIARIAADAGFADQSHFTRVFKRYVGTTPARYRRETHVRGVPGL